MEIEEETPELKIDEKAFLGILNNKDKPIESGGNSSKCYVCDYVLAGKPPNHAVRKDYTTTPVKGSKRPSRHYFITLCVWCSDRYFKNR